MCMCTRNQYQWHLYEKALHTRPLWPCSATCLGICRPACVSTGLSKRDCGQVPQTPKTLPVFLRDVKLALITLLCMPASKKPRNLARLHAKNRLLVRHEIENHAALLCTWCAEHTRHTMSDDTVSQDLDIKNSQQTIWHSW